MAVTHFTNHILQPISGQQRLKPPLQNRIIPDDNTTQIRQNLVVKHSLKSSKVEQSFKKSEVDVQRLVDFLYEDLPHVFDDHGLDWTAYEKDIKFQDPITKHDNINGYLFYISLLKLLFSANLQIHWIKQTGDYEITARWTTEMRYYGLPWKPLLVVTGTSVLGINPENGKFCSHMDYWDSVKNNDYLSFESLVDIMKQMCSYKTPELVTPEYQTLKRTTAYEVRNYSPFIVVETQNNKLAGSTGYNNEAGYIYGEHLRKEKIPMTIPVFTQSFDPGNFRISIQIVHSSKRNLNGLQDSMNRKNITSRRSFQEGFAAVLEFGGKPTEDIVREKENLLRASILSEGLKPKDGCLLACYYDPDKTNLFMMESYNGKITSYYY
ncbi:uncharacterized protein [Rutidosis leptorrhynchoides]|uniref:uncharacterized protein isoform X2 n=1 Tax=Rutidosis leptorrhynchoides TaxID=125765 RepID=UPI003A998191